MNDIFFYSILIFIGIINIFVLIGFFSFFKGVFYGAPFVPTSQENVKRMIEFAQIKKGEKIYDLGCGDGRIVFAAAEKGAIATGVEIARLVYLGAKIRKWITNSSGTLIRGSLWDTDVSDADVIFLYLLPEMMQQFYDQMYPTLKSGTRIISNGFELKNLKPEKILPHQSLTQGKIIRYVKP